MLTGADLIVQALEEAGVKVAFGLPGVHNLALWRALGDSPVRLVGGLVEGAAPDAGTPHRGWDVGGDHEDRRARGPGLADGAERVGGAGARGCERHAKAAGGAGVAVGGVGGRLLVAHADEPDG